MANKKTVDEQGYNANKTGKWLEAQVEAELLKYGIKSIMYSELDTKSGMEFVASCKRGFLLKHVPYKNMYGSNAYGEFVLYLFGKGVFRIECRYQGVPGSAQDKLPKLLGDCSCMQEQDVIIVLEGNGFTVNAKNWIKTSAKAVQHKHISVKALAEFKAWTKKLLTKQFKVPVASALNSMVKGAIDSVHTKKNTKTLPSKQS
jgi:hypothetical protein